MRFFEDRKDKSIVFPEYQSGCVCIIEICRDAVDKVRTHQYGFKMALHGGLHPTGS